jgi:(E)-4-hydroxy-3-methylbut-2-enyl-diphosphate synthase
MTNTPTSDAAATIKQIFEIAAAGADIVRVSCPDEASTKALKHIVYESPVPIVADIHFHYRRAIEAAEAGAACLRINPGNIGSDARVREVVNAARDHGCSLRIGVNAGSLEKDLLERYGRPTPEAMVESARRHIRVLEDNDFRAFKISVKASNVYLATAAYRGLAAVCDYPLHLGITEAGGQFSGTVKSAIGIGALLAEGIGDTIRVSLSADPVEEVKVGFEILKALELRRRGVTVIACPSCARQQFEVVRTVAELEKRLAHIAVPLSVSIIGCVVNGPGEARATDIGVTGGGKGSHLVYVSGIADHKIDDARLVDHVVELVEKKAREVAGEAAPVAAE